MNTDVTVVTERGQISIPAAIRKQLNLKPGQKLRWQKVGDNECRVFHDLTEDRPGPVAMSGYHSGRQGWQEACMFLGSSSNWLRRDGN